MRYKIVIGILFLLSWSLSVRGQATNYQFLLSTSSRSIYLFDGQEATNVTNDEWVVTYTTTDDSILTITDNITGQNIQRFDFAGQFQSFLTDFDASNTPIWVDITDIPFSDELIAEFEVIGTLEDGIYRFDPNSIQTSLSFIGQGVGQGSHLDVSSDGRFLTFDRNIERLTDLGTPFTRLTIVLYDLETTEWVYATSELQGNCGGAEWHPTENKILYTCGSSSGMRIYVTDIDSGETIRLPLSNERENRCFVWSPNGEAVAYHVGLGITIFSIETMSSEFIAYPSDLIEQGVTCIDWLPNT